jgi:hypothetical protein
MTEQRTLEPATTDEELVPDRDGGTMTEARTTPMPIAATGPAQPSTQAIADMGRRPEAAAPATAAPATAAQATAAPAANAAATPLFDEAATGQLRDRWSDVQAGFVDEPRSAVEHADALVAEVMQQLAQGFATERQHLEQQWSRGADVSTEDLRLALQRYRSFFDRLLSI